MRILLDVMGGDRPPGELVHGGIQMGRDRDIEVAFAGDPDLIQSVLKENGEQADGTFHIVPCSQVVRMDDPPVRAVREKSDSSLVRGLVELKTGAVDAFVSPGNTGAVVAASLFALGRLPGIPRPGILAPLPTLSGQDTYLIDAGATSDCHAEHLIHFAEMGSAYAHEIARIPSPTVGLLNIGAEQGKGNRLISKTFSLLEASRVRFIGNVEAHQLIRQRPADVIVSDGFVGNVCLKAIEGSVSSVTNLLKRSIQQSVVAKIGALLMRGAFQSLRSSMSYQERGGAPLLGVNGVVVIAHGRSNAQTIKSAMDVARREVEAKLADRIASAARRKDTDAS